MNGEPYITVNELIEELKKHPGDMLVDFSTLDFQRLKRRSPTVIQVEFSQLVYRDDENNVVVDNLE